MLSRQYLCIAKSKSAHVVPARRECIQKKVSLIILLLAYNFFLKVLAEQGPRIDFGVGEGARKVTSAFGFMVYILDTKYLFLKKRWGHVPGPLFWTALAEAHLNHEQLSEQAIE